MIVQLAMPKSCQRLPIGFVLTVEEEWVDAAKNSSARASAKRIGVRLGNKTIRRSRAGRVTHTDTRGHTYECVEFIPVETREQLQYGVLL